MKTIKRLLILILIAAAFAAGITFAKAKDMYEEVTAETPIDRKVEQIQSIEHYTPYEDLSDTYVNAVIATEDKRFRKHHGYDIIGGCRAILHNISAGQMIEGGSTITQQLARNMYFDQSIDLRRKIAEILVARQLEKNYSKEEILEMYVNVIYFGSGYYNIYDASHGYFGKDPKDLSDYEATMLAGIPNAPSAYSPDVNPELAEQRRLQVVSCMVAEGYIEEGEIS